MAYFEYFSEAEVLQVHEASLRVLNEVGVDFGYLPALELFKKAGCRVEGQRVYFPPKLVEEQVAKAPSQFTLHARNPNHNVIIGGNNSAFAPCYGPPLISNLDEGRREAGLEDFRNFVKLTHSSEFQDITGGVMVEPNDIPYERRTAEMVYAAMRFSDKPFMGGAFGARAAKETLDLAAIVFGSKDELAAKPPFISLLCSKTPLAYDERMLSAIMTYAEAGMPQLISSLAIAGSTAPVTMEGTLVVQNAEVLAGITLAQLVREGTPVVFSGSSASTAMRYGSLSIGSPETAMNTVATAQMARFYRLPSRSGGALTDSKICDCQSAYESMMCQLVASLVGINFVVHSAGILESYMVASYEKFVMDDEICGMCKRIKGGERISEERLAFNIIRDIGPGGEFLSSSHTLSNFRNEFYQPMLEERETFPAWIQHGGLSMERKANMKWKEILTNYTEPELPPEIDRDLKKYMEKI